MQQYERRAMSGTFSIVQLNFAGIKGALDKSWMVFTHDIFAGISHWLAAS